MVWTSMVSRCQNEKHRAFKHYGARGIAVCDRWLKFENFLADMGEKPVGLSIERVDNNRGYEPSNCRWATMTEQARNRRNNVRYAYDGSMLTVAELSAQTGIDEQVLTDRLAKRGWSVAAALAKGNPARRTITYGGETLRVCDWARKLGWKPQIIWHRIKAGWTVERTLTEPPKD